MSPDKEKVDVHSSHHDGKVRDDTNMIVSTTRKGENTKSSSWRSTVGWYLGSMSDSINNHLAVARYGTMATVLLLSAYGLSQTPLFSRFRTVTEIPASYFVNRRVIRGRLIRIEESEGDNHETSVHILVFHLSPIARLLNRSMFDLFVRATPSAAIGRRLETNDDELLKLEIAGIQFLQIGKATTRDLLDQLAAEKTVVTCQLLGRRIRQSHNGDTNASSLLYTTGLSASVVSTTAFRPEIANTFVADKFEQTAICKVSYRPNPYQLFPTDISLALVQWGYALPTETLFSSSDVSNSRIVDTTTQLQLIKRDAQYMKQLGHAEFEAAKEYKGMWADPKLRESRVDLIEEVDFQKQASILQKIWRWLRG